MTEILIYVLIYCFGLFVGFGLRSYLNRFTHYSGVIQVTRSEGKTLYSLVLNEYPEKLEFRKQVLFKVEAPDENLNRK